MGMQRFGLSIAIFVTASVLYAEVPLPDPEFPVMVADAHVEQEPADFPPPPDLPPEISPVDAADDADSAEDDEASVYNAAAAVPPISQAAGIVRLDPGRLGPVEPARDPSGEGDVADDVGEPADKPTDEPVEEPVAVDPNPVKEPEGWVFAWPDAARRAGGVVAERQVIAYYGNPNSRFMGILGESPIEEMAAQLIARASEYDALNGDIGVAPAFHIVYGTVHEDASIGLLRESKLMEYIRFAGEHGIIVFLDHQIGRYTVEEAIQAMLPYLAYDHVHLAIDPEWATTEPGKVIGGVRAEDINRAQQMISDYLKEHNIRGPKMLIVHQFNWRMIENREEVRTDYEGVQLIHNADGFGHPADKIVSWQFNVQAANMPLKGFKLFYPKSWRDGGYDDPLLSPGEVLQLEPVPVYIQYQ